MKEIYEYLNYRIFLNDYYLFRKSERASFSLRFFGDKIGIDASYLSKIFKEERHISAKSQATLCEYLKLSDEEERYLLVLILFNKAKKEEERSLYFEKLLSLRPTKQKNLEQSQYHFYSQWYYAALRAVLEFYPFYEGDSYRLLGEQLSPAIGAVQTKEGVELLLKLDLIYISDEGKYLLSDKAISTGDTWRSIAITNYQKKVIELSSESLARHSKEHRDISTVTMNITQKEFKIVQTMLKEFRSSVIEFANEVEDPNQTYQLNMQMIPLSQAVNDE